MPSLSHPEMHRTTLLNCDLMDKTYRDHHLFARCDQIRIFINFTSSRTLTFKISAASRILGIEALDKVSVGEEYSFFVESNSEPVAEILGPARKMVPVIIEEVLSKNGYNVKFQPVDVG